MPIQKKLRKKFRSFFAFKSIADSLITQLPEELNHTAGVREVGVTGVFLFGQNVEYLKIRNGEY